MTACRLRMAPDESQWFRSVQQRNLWCNVESSRPDSAGIEGQGHAAGKEPTSSTSARPSNHASPIGNIAQADLDISDRVFGEGASGQVFRAMLRRGGTCFDVAVKVPVSSRGKQVTDDCRKVHSSIAEPCRVLSQEGLTSLHRN